VPNTAAAEAKYFAKGVLLFLSMGANIGLKPS